MNGNITKEGITADLEAMARVGIGGAQIFNVDCGIPAGPVAFASPEWFGLVQHAIKEASRLGIELCLHNCAGWSSSGGPWVTPEQAMQRLTFTETKVTGPSVFHGALPQPPAKLDHYRDIAVLAFPTPQGEEATMKSLAPKVTATVPVRDGTHLFDNDNKTSLVLPLPGRGQRPHVQFEFAEPLAARSAELVLGPGGGGARGIIEASDDGKTFRNVRAFFLPRDAGETLFISLNNQPDPARFYRVAFTAGGLRAASIVVADVSFSSASRTGDVHAKSGINSGSMGADTAAAEAPPPGYEVKSSSIVNLSDKMDAAGKLQWDVPSGEWTILRIGHTPTGKENHPAQDSGRGLECDKMDASVFDAFWAGHVQKVLDGAGPLAGKGKALNNVLIDSYEVGGTNWTPRFRAEFQKRRGYDPLSWLVAVTGKVVDNPDLTERFLWDMRRTIADLFADNYYGRFQQLCQERGITASIEPYTGPFDSLQSGASADLPMGEFWTGKGNVSNAHSSLKLASSVGHIYGRPIIGAESFTAAPSETSGRWLEDPYSIKALGDQVFCRGINRYIFHRYAHQPWTNRLPGMTMGQWGSHFDRTNTWWEQGRAWLAYVTRCQFLLQQGRYVADAASFGGESAPVGTPEIALELPPGHDYDAVGADVLRTARVQDGSLVLDSGMRYRMLVLSQPDSIMSPGLLRQLRDWVAEGLILVGPPPQHAPGLSGYPQADADVKALASELWGPCDGKSVTEHAFGKGRVIWGQPAEQILKSLELTPDFAALAPGGARLDYIHRTLEGAEIYFVSNQEHRVVEVQGAFRTAGRTPELWHPDTGRIEEAPVWHQENGGTVVSLRLDPAGSVFVVFRKPARPDSLVSARITPTEPALQSPPPELTVLKAEYGVFPAAPLGCADVTAKVRQLAAAGTTRIRAGNQLAGDPAPGTPKQLRIEFEGGEPEAMVVAEGKSVDLPENARIARAHFGVLPATVTTEPVTVDVTELLTSQVRDGRLSVMATNKLAGTDLAYGIKKELAVDYRHRGVRRMLRVAEHEMLNLPADGSDVSPPPVGEVFISTADGQPRLRAWQPCKVEATNVAGKTLTAEIADMPQPVEATGGWELSFPAGWGAPEKIAFPALLCWTEHEDPGVKYFSGTAAYRKTIQLPPEMFGNGRSIWLDLGLIRNIAEVSVNGKPCGILWKQPFRADITAAAKPGTNDLEIKVTNLWANRLIGDELLPPDREWKTNKQLKEWPQWVLEGKPSPTGRFTFTTWHHWTQDDSLQPSGLFGPVRVHSTVEQPLK